MMINHVVDDVKIETSYKQIRSMSVIQYRPPDVLVKRICSCAGEQATSHTHKVFLCEIVIVEVDLSSGLPITH